MSRAPSCSIVLRDQEGVVRASYNPNKSGLGTQ